MIGRPPPKSDACGGNTAQVVRQRATYDIKCPAAKIKVDSLGGTSYAAAGCGRPATYMCSGSNFMTDGTCLRER
jgi:hypothetical protein